MHPKREQKLCNVPFYTSYHSEIWYRIHTTSGVNWRLEVLGKRPCVLHVLPEVCTRSRDTVPKHPCTSTCLMLPYYTKRQPSHKTLRTSWRTPSVAAARNSSVRVRTHLRMPTVPNSGAKILNILKTSIGHSKVMDSSPLTYKDVRW